jgi:multiple sugar transport system substrate-binding protein
MFMQRNAFMPLDDFMAKDTAFGARLKDIYPQCFDGFQYNGKTYAIAYSQNLYGLYYNKTIFDKWNQAHPNDRIEYPDGTWDVKKFTQVAKKLTLDTDGDGRVDQYGTQTPGLAFYQINPVFRRFGVEMFSPDKKHCIIDQPAAIEAMDFYFGLSLRENAAPLLAGPNARSSGAVIGGPEEMFMAGRIAMWEAESEWRFEFARRIKSFEWDVAEPPSAKARSCGYECFAMSITSDSPHAAEAWKFISYLTSPEGQKVMLKHRIGIPVLKSLCESPEYFMNPAELPAHKEAYLKTIEYGGDCPALRSFQEIESVVSDELMLGMIGKKSTEAACKDAAKAANKLLAEEEE